MANLLLLFVSLPQGCAEPSVSDKSLYSTFARTFPTSGQSIESLMAVLHEFQWMNVSIVSSDNADNKAMVQEMQEKLREDGVTVKYTKKFPHSTFDYFARMGADFAPLHSGVLRQILEATKVRTRSRYIKVVHFGSSELLLF